MHCFHYQGASYKPVPYSNIITFSSHIQDEEEWPSLSVFELTNTDLSVARRDVSHDSGIHEISEEKRRSVKRIE